MINLILGSIFALAGGITIGSIAGFDNFIILPICTVFAGGMFMGIYLKEEAE